MKISFVEPHLRIFGGIRRIVEFGHRLAERGHDVTIFHPEGTPCDWMRCAARTRPSAELLADTHDVIIYNDPNPVDYALVRDANARLKVFYVLGLYQKERLVGLDPRLLLPRGERLRILRRSLRSPYLKLANATWEREWLRQHMGIEAELALGGIDTELFRPIEDVRPSGASPVRLLASGDPRPTKGMADIRTAVEILRRTHPDVVLETYHGRGVPQEDLARVYGSAHVFIEASWSSGAGWNNPVAEAMACGAPVVCTDIGAVGDFAFDGRTALLVPAHDPPALAGAIARLIDEPELRERLRGNALEHIRSFDWDDAVSRLEAILGAHLAESGFNPSYVGARDDILDLVPPGVRHVLDVGCSAGALGESIKQAHGARVTGIEISPEMAGVARRKLDRVIVGDAEEIDLAAHVPPGEIDCAIFADVLEHQRDPWAMLGRTASLLGDGGVVIVSLPNVRHYSTLVSLGLRGRWPYRDRGIHDRTHLRFFTLSNVRDLFRSAGLEIVTIRRHYRIIERPHRVNRISRWLAVPPFRELFAFQYLVVARKAGRPAPVGD